MFFGACASSRMLVSLGKRLVPPKFVVCAVRAFIGLLVSRVRYKLHCCLRTGFNYRVFIIATACMWLY